MGSLAPALRQRLEQRGQQPSAGTALLVPGGSGLQGQGGKRGDSERPRRPEPPARGAGLPRGPPPSSCLAGDTCGGAWGSHRH